MERVRKKVKDGHHLPPVSFSLLSGEKGEIYLWTAFRPCQTAEEQAPPARATLYQKLKKYGIALPRR
jgi:hypothetical protein